MGIFLSVMSGKFQGNALFTSVKSGRNQKNTGVLFSYLSMQENIPTGNQLEKMPLQFIKKVKLLFIYCSMH